MDDALFRELVPLLDSPVRSGARYWSYCPAHPDGARNRGGGGLAGRSLSLHPSYGLDCHANNRDCKFTDILAGLRARKKGGPDSSKPKVQASYGTDSLRINDTTYRLAKAYEYRDPATGDLLAVKGRFEEEGWQPPPDDPDAKPGKTFMWRLPEGTWREGIKKRFSNTTSDLPLWGAETVIANPDARVWFTEGEKAAEAIRRAGEIAVTGGWSSSVTTLPAAAFEVLRGRDVVLFPDNDEAGRKYMLKVWQQIRGLAATIATVRAPVPPKGDAHEYIGAGGKLDDLLKGIVLKPMVEVRSSARIIIKIPTEAGTVEFDFDEMEAPAPHSIMADLTVRHPAETEPFTLRINLLSSSAREGLARSAREQFGKDTNWTTTISAAFNRVTPAFKGMEHGKPLTDLPLSQELRFEVPIILPAGVSTILFGDGSTGKSYIAMSMAIAMALGDQFAGMRASYGGVLWIDYETDSDDGETFRRRVRRLLRGMGYEPDILEEEGSGFMLRYWPARGVPLWQQADAIRRHCDKHQISTVIIDSGAPACGGNPEKSENATMFFNALSRIRRTSLTICHQTKEAVALGKSDKPFGSAFWHNLPRRTWFVAREQEEGGDSIQVGIFCRKGNDGQLPYPFAFELSFVGADGPAQLRRREMSDVPAFSYHRALGPRISELLCREPWLSVGEISENLDAPVDTVRQALVRGRGRYFVMRGRGTKDDPQQWSANLRGAVAGDD